MPIPERYNALPKSDLPSAVLELGQLFVAYAHDVTNGTRTAPTFAEALRLHQLFDAVATSTTTGHRIDLSGLQ